MATQNDLSRDFLVEEIVADAQAAYDQREAELGEEVTRELERRVLLSVLDRKWREHLYEMDYLQEGIGLRAMAQRDPLVEYQKEGFDMFSAMMDAIQEESVGFLFNLEVQVDGEPSADQAPVGEVPVGQAPAELDAEGVLAALASGWIRGRRAAHHRQGPGTFGRRGAAHLQRAGTRLGRSRGAHRAVRPAGPGQPAERCPAA